MRRLVYLGIDLLCPVLESVSRMGYEIIKIFTCPCDNVTEFNTRVVEFAKENGIPYTTERITRQDMESLRDAGCELLLCAGYYYRVPVTDAFPMVNVHPAPLPRCRGAWPMPQILLGADTEGGVVFHKMDADFDTGDILFQETFSVGGEELLTDYMEKVFGLLPKMTEKFLEDPEKALREAYPQGDGRYLDCPTEKDWTISDRMTAQEADRILRAFYGYECIYEGAGCRYELIGARAKTGSDGAACHAASAGGSVSNHAASEETGAVAAGGSALNHAVSAAERVRLPLRDGYVTAERIREL